MLPGRERLLPKKGGGHMKNGAATGSISHMETLFRRSPAADSSQPTYQYNQMMSLKKSSHDEVGHKIFFMWNKFNLQIAPLGALPPNRVQITNTSYSPHVPELHRRKKCGINRQKKTSRFDFNNSGSIIYTYLLVPNSSVSNIIRKRMPRDNWLP